jgi:phosphoribosylaminoimidazole carboxylase PurE protein
MMYNERMKVALFLASASDKDHGQKIIDVLSAFDVNVESFVLSAHKVPEKVFAKIQELNEAAEPTVIITVVGMSNGIGGVLAASSVHPVIVCPLFSDNADYLTNIHSSLQMPSEVPAMTVLHPKNAALAAVKILAEGNEELKKKVEEGISKVKGKYE